MAKDPKKVRAGKLRWKGVSERRKRAITSAAGKKGGAATAKLWRKLRAAHYPQASA